MTEVVSTFDPERDSRRLAAMRTEWHTVATITAWETRIYGMVQDQRELRHAGRWVGGPRDWLGVIGRGRHEVTHSAIVAWLLDPGMRHGLGARFLERTLGHCFKDGAFGDLTTARAETEVTRGQGRADIVVWADEFTLVIENKVDALEGDDQCEYYFRAFADEVNPHFIFLTPDGRAPTSVSEEAAEAYESLSYLDIAEFLEASLAARATDRQAEARSVAIDYLETLGRDLARRK